MFEADALTETAKVELLRYGDRKGSTARPCKTWCFEARSEFSYKPMTIFE